MQTYQRESKPIQDVYAQVTQLFNSAPDLLEDFKQFLPESAAQAKAQAAAKQAAEDAAMLSDVRGEPEYLNSVQRAQLTPNASQNPKMPPVGNFAPPPASGGDRKKKRPAPGPAPIQGQVYTNADGTGLATQLHRAASGQTGSSSKVSEPPSLLGLFPETYFVSMS